MGPLEKQSSDSDSDDEYSMYSPSSSSEDIEIEDDNAAEKKKYIVFENELDKLFKFCQQCGSIIATKTKHLKGSMIIIKSTCLRGHSNK